MKRSWEYGIHRDDVRLGQYEEMVVIQLLPCDACKEWLKYGVQNVGGGDAGSSRHRRRRRRRRRWSRSRIIMRLPSAQLDLDRASARHARAHEFCRQRDVFVRKESFWRVVQGITTQWTRHKATPRGCSYTRKLLSPSEGSKSIDSSSRAPRSGSSSGDDASRWLIKGE